MTRLVYNKPLWRISISTSSEAEEAVSECLASLSKATASSYTDVETGDVRVSVYLRARPDGWRQALRREISRIQSCGLNAGSARIAVQRVRPASWKESWKRHFKPLEIGPQLLIRPSWSKRRARKGQSTIILDPGLSFGTGQHPTTSFCLDQLARRREPGRPQSMLDIGTGSGILAIAAAKLGFAPVVAFDFDPDAVRVARSNARRNHVSNRVKIGAGDLTKMPVRGDRRYDVICANLISDLLIAERRRILSRLREGGVLVLAGVLKSEFAEVRRAYEQAGLRVSASRTEREWQSAAFIKR